MTAALLDHLWQSTLFAGGVWLIALASRGERAAVRHALWVIAALKFLVPFSWLFALGALFSFAMPTDAGPPALGVEIGVAAPVMSPALSVLADVRAPVPAGGFGLALVWLAGATVVGTRWLRAARAATEIARTARPAPDVAADVRLTDADIGPAVARVIEPVVLLPAALLTRLTRAQLDAVIAHERAHIARRDNLLAHAQRLVETLFWFHPLVWWIGRQQVDERERACDERVLESGHDPSAYAEGILAVCRFSLAVPARAAAVYALSGDLTLRIRNILGASRPHAIGALKAAALSIVSLAVAAGPLAAGAVDDAARRHAAFVTNARVLDSAAIFVTPARGAGTLAVSADRHEVHVRNSTLRELIAEAYDARPGQISGDGEWLDATRYEIRAVSTAALADPEKLDPRVLRGLVNKLLASRFDLRIVVNGREVTPADVTP